MIIFKKYPGMVLATYMRIPEISGRSPLRVKQTEQKNMRKTCIIPLTLWVPKNYHLVSQTKNHFFYTQINSAVFFTPSSPPPPPPPPPLSESMGEHFRRSSFHSLSFFPVAFISAGGAVDNMNTTSMFHIQSKA